MEASVALIAEDLAAAYNAYAKETGATWSVINSNLTYNIDKIMPGLKVVVGEFYDLIGAKLYEASTNADVETFAQLMMVANAATKAFDPVSYVGSSKYVNYDGTYTAGNNVETLKTAMLVDYETLIGLSTETIGDVFGEDTSSNFANATVAVFTTGNDSETLTNSSEIIATLDGTDTIYAAGGNDKLIGGTGVDTFYGQDGNDHLYGYRGDDILDGSDGNDKIVGGLGDDNISGGAGDDYILAQAGDDTVSTGSGNDEVYASIGDDVVTIDGVGNKTISFGTGSDKLIISQAGVDSLGSYSIFRSTAQNEWTLTNSSDETISITNLFSTDNAPEWWEGSLFVDSKEYILLDDLGDQGSPSDWDNNNAIHAFAHRTSSSAMEVILIEVGLNGGTFVPQSRLIGNVNYAGFTKIDSDGTDIFTVYGTKGDDRIHTGSNDDIVYAGEGNDRIQSGDGKDTMYGGLGDDVFMVSNTALTEDILIDGGAGSNTLMFSSSEDSMSSWHTTFSDMDNETYRAVDIDISNCPS